MSRTTRRFMTERNYREARKGRTSHRCRSGTPHKTLRALGMVFVDELGVERPTLWVEFRSPAAPWAPATSGPSKDRGGMLMSPSTSGMWRDEYAWGDVRTKRAVKRAERQRWQREAASEALPEVEPEPAFIIEPQAAHDEWLDWYAWQELADELFWADFDAGI